MSYDRMNLLYSYFFAHCSVCHIPLPVPTLVPMIMMIPRPTYLISDIHNMQIVPADTIICKTELPVPVSICPILYPHPYHGIATFRTTNKPKQTYLGGFYDSNQTKNKTATQRGYYCQCHIVFWHHPWQTNNGDGRRSRRLLLLIVYHNHRWCGILTRRTKITMYQVFFRRTVLVNARISGYR